MGYHLLVVDDEERIRGLIGKYARFEGHTVTEAQDGMQAIELCRKEQFDVIVLDIMMPELDGFSACKQIKKITDAPVIMLSARGEEYDKIHGFELGVDDYVVKPFSPRELMMRISAIMNRVADKQEKVNKDIISLDGLTVDFTGRLVYIDGEKVDMSPREYDLLFYMVRNRGVALSREKLIRDVWGYDFYGDDRTLDTHIKLIRKRLGAYSTRIVTLRGVGYRFEG